MHLPLERTQLSGMKSWKVPMELAGPLANKDKHFLFLDGALKLTPLQFQRIEMERMIFLQDLWQGRGTSLHRIYSSG